MRNRSKSVKSHKRIVYSLKKLIVGKRNISVDEIREIIVETRRATQDTNVSNHIFRELIDYPNFKESLSNVIKGKNFDIVNFGPPYLIDSSLDDNLNFCTIVLDCFSEDLTFYLQLKEEVEKALLNSEFDKTNALLDEVEERIGVSFWSISTRYSNFFFAGEDEDLLNYHKQKYSNTVSEDDSNSATTFSISLLEKELTKSRKTQTYEGYRHSLNRQIEDLTFHGYQNMVDTIKFLSDFEPSADYSELRVLCSRIPLLRLPDLFNFFMRLLKISYLRNIEIPRTTRSLERISNKINNESLKITISKIKNDYSGKFNSEETIKNITNYYLSENYNEVINLSEQLFNTDPAKSHLFEIVAKSIESEDELVNISGLTQEIIALIFRIHNNKDFEKSLKRLKLVFLNLKQFDWAYHLKAQIDKYTFKEQGSVSFKYNFVDIEQIRLPPFDNAAILRAFNNGNQEGISQYYDKYENTLEILKFALNIESQDLQKTPEWRRYKTKADYLSFSRKYDEALEFFNKAYELEISEIKKDDIEAKIIFTLLKARREVEAIIRISHCLIENKEPSNLPLLQTAKYIIGNVNNESELDFLEASAIVLHYYNLKYPNDDVTQEVANVCEQLLKKQNIFSVEEFKVENWSCSRFILTHVLSVDVLDGFITFFEDELEVYSTKISLCLDLLQSQNIESDKKLFNHVLGDYNSTFNRMILLICTNEANEGRIRVDKESLKVVLNDELAEDFNLYDRNNQEHDMKFIPIDDDWKSVELTGGDRTSFILNLVSRIFKEYAVNKLYGLDNCLNLNFRHGELRNHLWSPLRQQNITGKKISENKFNVDSVFADYNLLGNELKETLKHKLNKLLSDIEYTIFNFRKRCNADAIDLIEDDDRFFQFFLNKEDLLEANEAFSSGKSLDSIIELVFSILHSRTNEILKNIRQTHITELKEKFEKIFNSFDKSTDKGPHEFRNKIRLAKTGILERIEEVEEWFDWAEEPKNPFNFGATFEKATTIIESLYPSIKFDFQRNINSFILIKPKFFTSLVAIFTLALENAAKHSGLEDGVRVIFKIYENNGNIKIVVRNSISEATKTIIDGKIPGIKGDLKKDVTDKAAKDSGSGIFKIKSLLINKMKINASIDIFRDFDDFVLEIDIEKKMELMHENFNS